MGMYDSIYVNIDNLPISEEEKKMIGKNHEFQTKDFDCELKRYEITDDGRLTKNEYDSRFDENEKSALFALTGQLGAIIHENERTEAVDYSGNLYFYTHLGSYNRPVSPDWFGFIGKFEAGKLIDIELIEKS